MNKEILSSAAAKLEVLKDLDAKTIIARIEEQKKQIERFEYLQQFKDAPTDSEQFKTESPTEFEDIKKIDRHAEKRTRRQLSLMSKAIQQKDLTEDELEAVIAAIVDSDVLASQ